ncbi:MAG: MarR family transcriptional regulator [Oscillibacter sp.]|nr:MarR family transcriptional regulator [Oscillibacter sp.]
MVCDEQDKKRLGPMMARVSQLAKTCMDVRVSRYGVTPAQTHVLLYLHHCGGQAPQCDLTRFMRVKPSTANGVLDRLEEKGFIQRSVSGSDARRRLITLTPKGAEQQALFQKSFLEVEQTMTRGFTPEEKTLLTALLERTIQNLEEDRAT